VHSKQPGRSVSQLFYQHPAHGWTPAIGVAWAVDSKEVLARIGNVAKGGSKLRRNPLAVSSANGDYPLHWAA